MRWYCLAPLLFAVFVLWHMPATAEDLRRSREMICSEAYRGRLGCTVIFDALAASSWFGFLGASWWVAVFVAPVLSQAVEWGLSRWRTGWTVEAWRTYAAHCDHVDEDCEYGPRKRREPSSERVRLRSWRKVTLNPVFTPA